MLRFVVIRGKKMWSVSSKRACVEQWYEVTTSIKRSGMHELATTPCSAALFPIVQIVLKDQEDQATSHYFHSS